MRPPTPVAQMTPGQLSARRLPSSQTIPGFPNVLPNTGNQEADAKRHTQPMTVRRDLFRTASTASATIHQTFITPTANAVAISAQQQPTQNRP